MIDLPPPDDPALRTIWAKFDHTNGDSFPLFAHLEDTAAVADQLYDRWFSGAQRKLLADTIGSDDEAKQLMVWLAASHDIGKTTVAFAIKAEPCVTRMRDAGFEFPPTDPPREDQKQYPHGLAGQLAVDAYLRAKVQGRAKGVAPIAEIVGGHHGVFPGNPRIPYLFGEGEHACWRGAREALLQRADQLSEMSDGTWQRILRSRIPETAQVLLNGFLIVCDWIASNQWLFPYDRASAASARAAHALRSLDFGDHWAPVTVPDPSSYFEERFGISQPRPVQSAAVELVANLEETSLLLIEAPTGEGKTEIGFACAEALAAKFGAHGAAIALPTRATTNAMFGRVLDWLRSGGRRGHTVSVSLAHAKAEFDERYERLFRGDDDRGGAQNIYDENENLGAEDAVTGNLWFRGRKQRVLADFTVGTIDQLLFMALKARHLTLRHLGFSGKVVVIDEVHAADAFMQTYLLRALQWLGAYGVPVIALSATLPPALRAALLQAYRTGARQTAVQQPVFEDAPVDPEIASLAEATGYPLITAIGATNRQQVSPEQSGRRTTYRVEQLVGDSRDTSAIAAAARAEAADGGCIAVVLDTVDRAQRVYADLVTDCPGEIRLFHSRFTVESRNRSEQDLIERLGRNPPQRPKSMIVVATQVVESSLDVDFDLMFTDIAPVDLLLQRMGRVHRHARRAEDRPVSMREPRILLTGGIGLLAGDQPPEFERGVETVYGDASLLRTTAALREHRLTSGRETITVPDDVPSLIRSTYSAEFASPSGWEDRMATAEQRQREKLRDQQERSARFAIQPPGAGGIADWSRLSYSEASEEHLGAAQVRDAELSLEVVLVQQRADGFTSLPWLLPPHGGERIDLISGIEPELARAVATCTVSLPSWMTRGAALDRVLDELERSGFEAWQSSPWLRGMLPLILDEELTATVGGHRIRYEQRIGILIDREVTE
ncbi:CRISPR-associated helicase Cas3' [Leucobacter sp. wl10]|uniref:CRISPR-associated helicase Cas3' n=1 Tax=Leucobacter sp. wl10 TaxID=2304677 RepID=UPI000E5A5FF5|nr:CRISPR-associated helicase Cas3' [Leucobacter sp. wl10]RGE19818.1 CRISPR-associated helicase Cas3' [Leucobacter sp. wl10]